MAKDTRDDRTLLELITETISKFPPRPDNDNARSFRTISVDYLKGKLTHPQFNLLYTPEKTATQMADEIIRILGTNRRRLSANPPRPADETLSHKWHLPRPRNIRRTATSTLEKGILIKF
jgi:hypothetical protein